MQLLGDRVELQPEGYAVDRRYPDIFYVPENAEFHACAKAACAGRTAAATQQLTLRAGRRLRAALGLPSPAGKTDRRHGLAAGRRRGRDGTLCHKPCTVSGGGKSEISKSIAQRHAQGPVFVSDYHSDMDQVAEILQKDFSAIYKQPHAGRRARSGRF